MIILSIALNESLGRKCSGRKTTDRFTILGAASPGWQAGPFRRSHRLGSNDKEKGLIAAGLSSPWPPHWKLLASNELTSRA